jgi:CheY-like chemotaxis protein/predicted regulator of Ras-like GTPase activity (Roadblock/LC7/MglB family)
MTGADTCRVLLVDDEEALVWSLSSRLSRSRPHLQVATAHDGETALTHLDRGPIDLLVADVRLPGMSGIDLVLEARRRKPSLPVIVMTAFKTSDHDKRLAMATSTSFLDKPFRFERFLALVDEGLARPGFSGAISVQTLPDIVQLYVMSGTTGLLLVRRRDIEGELWFREGAIVHAVTSIGAVGEDAFFDIVLWSGGEFSMRMGAIPPEITVSTNTTELLMESCRLLDESRHAEETRPSRTGWTVAPPPPGSSSLPPAPDGGSSPPSAPFEDHTQRAIKEDHMNIKEALSKLNSIDGFIGATLVDSESGMVLGQEGGGTLNLEVASAGNTEVVRAKRKTMANLNLKDGIEDILITLGKQYHLIRPLRSRSALFFYVALDRTRANLAMARIALADVEKDLQVLSLSPRSSPRRRTSPPRLASPLDRGEAGAFGRASNAKAGVRSLDTGWARTLRLGLWLDVQRWERWRCQRIMAWRIGSRSCCWSRTTRTSARPWPGSFAPINSRFERPARAPTRSPTSPSTRRISSSPTMCCRTATRCGCCRRCARCRRRCPSCCSPATARSTSRCGP